MNTLSFFSGIGGLDLGIQEYTRPLAFCDTETFCQRNMRKRHPGTYIHGDIRTFPRERFGDIGLIVGGFPCQDISNAGKGDGIRGKRTGLVWALLDLVDHYKPSLVFLENVSNLRNKGMEHLLVALDELDYDVRWCIITGLSVGALHRRGRTFIVAKHRIKPLPAASFESPLSTPAVDWSCEPDIQRAHCESLCDPKHNNTRLRALGNAVIPQQARRAFHLLFGQADNKTVQCLETAWTKSVAEWSGTPAEAISSFGSYCQGQLCSLPQNIRPVVVRFPPSIQRFPPNSFSSNANRYGICAADADQRAPESCVQAGRKQSG